MAPNDSASMSFKDPLPDDSSDHHALVDPQPTEDATNVLYASPPPPFGHPLLEHFGFAKGYVNLNHGSYGSLPTPLLPHLNTLSARIESNPDLFMRLHYDKLLRSIRAKLATLIHADTDEVVLCPNATHGVNTVVRNLEWREGDIVVGTTVTYGAVTRTLAYLADTNPHPTHLTFPLTFPTTHAEILSRWRDFITKTRSEQLALWEATKTPNTASSRKPRLLLVIDSLTSNPGVRLPWEAMVKVAQEVEALEGELASGEEKTLLTLIDAAHSIGQIDTDVRASGCDFWVSNCHKWLFVKRGCAVMYVPKRNQHFIRTSFPTSFYYLSPKDVKTGSESFVAQFTWNGTHDPVPYLSVTHALDFRAWLGGERAINDYCHALALSGGRKLAQILGTQMMDESEDAEGVANMVNVSLPITLPPSESTNATFRHELLETYNCYVAHYYHNGKWWVRCSVQVWNEESDFEYVGNALLKICRKLESEAVLKN